MANLETPFRPSDISSGLVGYWKFNNNAVDSSGSGYTLTAEGTPTYTTDTYWKDSEKSAHLITASNQYFWIAGASAPLIQTDSTAFAVFVKFKYTAYIGTFFAKWGTGGDSFALTTGATGTISCFINGSSQDTLTAATSGLVEGKWHDLLVTMDETANTINWYVDGNLKQSTAWTGTFLDDGTGKFSIGTYFDGATPSQKFGGEIKDVAVWNGTLPTALQAKSLTLGVDLFKYAYRPNNVSTQPTHWWKLNEVSGNRADSVSTNPLTLTDNNTVLSSGGYVEGVGADFELSNAEFLSTANDSSLDFGTGSFSIRTRVKFESIALDYQCICSKWSGSAGYHWKMIPNVGGPLVHFGNGTGNVSFTIPALVAGVFYDFALTYNGTKFKFYIDGIQTGSDQNPQSGGYDGSADDFNIGILDPTSYYFDGVMEDFAIWKGYALTDAEIKSLACALPIQRQGIVSYWKMDEASGNAIDSIGTNTGVETGGTIASDTGKVSLARNFEADDTEHFNITTNASVAITTDLTVISWYKPESSGTPMFLLDRSSSTGFGLFQTGGYWYFRIKDIDSPQPAITANGVWTHLAGLWDGAKLRFFTEGSEYLTGNASTTAPDDNSTDLRIGARSNDTGYCDGLMDEVILAKRYFRPEEIKAVYLKGLNGKEVTSSERSSFIPRAIMF